jgi:hypothetical protein
VPVALVEAARAYGLEMRADGFSWTALPPRSRFQWSGRTPAKDREVRYSFWLPSLDETSRKLLPQLVSSAAANLAEGEPCPPVEQSAELVKMLGVERVVSVCFEPSELYRKEFKKGVVHGIVNHGALTIMVVLVNDLSTAIVPMPEGVGARGRPSP